MFSLNDDTSLKKLNSYSNAIVKKNKSKPKKVKHLKDDPLTNKLTDDMDTFSP